MSVRERMKKYREHGAGADLVRVEVLVPASRRAEVVAAAGQMRADYRRRKQEVSRSLERALERYRARILDNIDLDRVSDIEQKARLVGHALIERGDARAFAMGRELLAQLDSM